MASARNRDKGDQDGRVLDLTGALADPTRLALYQDLVSADVPVTVKELAGRFSLHPNVIRTHLQRLVDVGLVEAETRRSGGGGRPARIYSPSKNVSTLQFPPRDYRLLADVLLRSIRREDSDTQTSLEDTAVEVGHNLARHMTDRAANDAATDPSCRLEDLARIASSLGLHPETSSVSESESRIEIRNCVFSELVDEYPELICPLHTAMLRGIAEEHFPGCDIDTHTGPDAKSGPCSLTIKARAIATLRPGA